MAAMALVLLSGSWTLIFLGLLMWEVIIGLPITLIASFSVGSPGASKSLGQPSKLLPYGGLTRWHG